MCVMYVMPCTHINVCDAVCDVSHAEFKLAVHQFGYRVNGRAGGLQQRHDDGRVGCQHEGRQQQQEQEHYSRGRTHWHLTGTCNDVQHTVTLLSQCHSSSLHATGRYTLVTLPRIVTPYRDNVDGTRARVTYQKLVTR